MLEELRKRHPGVSRRASISRTAAGAGASTSQHTRERDGGRARPLLADVDAERSATKSTLTDFDPDGEIKIVAAALYAVSELPDDQLLAIARRMTADERAARAARLHRRRARTGGTVPAARSSGPPTASTS